MKLFNEAFDPSKFECIPLIDKNHLPWNGTDTYLYNHCVRENLLTPGTRIIILNDESGVLTYLLREFNPTVTADSLFAKQAIEKNFLNNGEDPSQYTFLNSVEFATGEFEKFDLVLIKIPKFSRYLVDQIASLTRCTDKETLYLSSGMVKHISNHCKNTLEKRIGETLVHKVEKKAILFSSTLKKKRPMKLKPTYTFGIYGLGEFTSYSNCFSAGKLDRGTGHLIANMPTDLTGKVVDLGCGFGAISRKISTSCLNVTDLYAVDISCMSVESTKLSVPEAKVLWSDGLTSFDDESLDAVVSNPPFHLDTSFSVNMGLRLFKQVTFKLKPGGRFIMVANSGLNYKPYLGKMFSSVDVIFQDRKYTVFEAVK